MNFEETLIRIFLTPIVFILASCFSTFIAIFEFLRFPIDMVMELWR